MLWEKLRVLVNAETMNSNSFLIEPTNSDMKDAKNENNLPYPNDNPDDFVNIDDIQIIISAVKIYSSLSNFYLLSKRPSQSMKFCKLLLQ